MSVTCTRTSTPSSSCSSSPSPPRRRPSAAAVIEGHYNVDFAGLETWEDPTPRPSPFTFEDLRDAFVAAAKNQYLHRATLPSREERIRCSKERDRNSLVIALNVYAKQHNMQPFELEFVEVKEKNLIDEHGKGYMHFNFLAKVSDGTLQLFFSEVHPACREDDDVYLCIPLNESDNGVCLGCESRAKDLVHPTVGGFLGGHKAVDFPFIEHYSDGDEDDGFHL